MTDQDNLRDRIMEPIWQNTMLTTEGAKRIAQAIIDELGLRVEGQMGVDGEDPIWEERVAGKWEVEQ